MRADALHLLKQQSAGLGDRTTRKHDAARGKSAEAERRGRGVAVADGNTRRIDFQFMRGDLRQRRFMPLAMVLYSDGNDHRAVRQHPHRGGFVSRYDPGLALDPFHLAVAALLRVECKADADPAAVRLPALLT